MGYIITACPKMPSGFYDVYNENNGNRYDVNTNKKHRSCTCPHWTFRLKKSRGKCKHIEMAEKKGGWNE